jgi:hypothetical protein
MRRKPAFRALSLSVLVFLAACGPRCLDDVRDQVTGKTSAEVESFLSEPDKREPMIVSGERWTWHGYTYDDGRCPGEVVDLQIIFDRQGSELRVTDRSSVSALPHPTAGR